MKAQKLDFEDTKSSILAISWHLFTSSVIRTFYDFIFVFFTLPGKREYFKIHVHNTFTKGYQDTKIQNIKLSLYGILLYTPMVPHISLSATVYQA